MPMTPEQAQEVQKISDPDHLRYLRAKLITQRASGIGRLTVRSPVSQRDVEFRSDAEMAAAIADLDRRIQSLEGGSPVQIVNIRNARGW